MTVEAYVGGGPWGPHYAVRSEGGSTVVWEAQEGGAGGAGSVEVVEVGPDGWARFWEAVEAAGAWGWAPDYDEPGVLDGTSWCLRLEHGDRRVEAGGSNAGPDGFEVLQRALEELVEGRPWR